MHYIREGLVFMIISIVSPELQSLITAMMASAMVASVDYMARRAAAANDNQASAWPERTFILEMAA